MKSILRIIFGVLVGIAIFIGIVFSIAFLLRLFHIQISFAKADYVGRCLDNAVEIGLGVLIILFGPPQLKRKLASGQLSAEKAEKTKKALKLILPIGILMIAYGVLRIFGVL